MTDPIAVMDTAGGWKRARETTSKLRPDLEKALDAIRHAGGSFKIDDHGYFVAPGEMVLAIRARDGRAEAITSAQVRELRQFGKIDPDGEGSYQIRRATS